MLGEQPDVWIQCIEGFSSGRKALQFATHQETHDCKVYTSSSSMRKQIVTVPAVLKDRREMPENAQVGYTVQERAE